ncbi:MAG TPA: alpha-1,4-glucan--maltose-1-phosphate maltosyltransferase [Streptosporangiaceae bacterium]|nr:alpha-1,4-glucan--maltose-1-phosphate maltosyltransferase [Streptosporangiaceae bacterium]
MIGRIPILDVQPQVECGRRPAKATAGETLQITALVFREGHEMLGAGVVLRDPQGVASELVIMRELTEGSDRYGAEVTPRGEGLWHFRVDAWGDPIAHWRHDCAIKVPIGQDVDLMLAEGARLFDRAARLARKAEAARSSPAEPAAGKRAKAARKLFTSVADTLREATEAPIDRLGAAFTQEVTEALGQFPVRELLTHSAWCPLIVHRQRALYSSWYEFFPRSEGAKVDPLGKRAPVSGTLRTAARRLDAIAAMGFDVVYLPPIHPIGTTARKGKNNSLAAGPFDPGSPWAIGSPAGGHDAIHPDLGTISDFDAFVSRAGELGLEVAIDLALQASPDHPWASKHPEWFTTRADGTIAYAENPPKKYQDIYPLNFDNDPDGIYAEIARIVRYWISHGVTIFRVDNPHTKPLPFWERLLAEIAATDPHVLFLSEAFTRPPMMRALAEIGFHQSYTYFTWRDTAAELTEYLTELAGPAAAYMRPNFFVNTPDILCRYLQHAPPAAFRARAVLAAMLCPSWGVYAGFELCENTPLRPGSEEYFESEKYQYKPRDWAAAARRPADITPFISRLNAIRRSHPALWQLRNLRFHFPDRPEFLCFSKSAGASAPAGESAGDGADGDTVLVVVNLDPHTPRETTIWLDGAALGIDVSAGFTVTDELTGMSYRWSEANYVRLDPASAPAHIFKVTADQRS